MTVVVRETKETTIRCELNLGAGAATVATGMPFLDHMLTAFARYSGLDLNVRATGDLSHHLIEDVGICVGSALAGVLPSTAARYGDRIIPMDDALVHCALDLGGRPYYRGPLPSALYDHWMRSFSDNANATLHLRVLRGTDRHHIVEAAYQGRRRAATRGSCVDADASCRRVPRCRRGPRGEGNGLREPSRCR